MPASSGSAPGFLEKTAKRRLPGSGWMRPRIRVERRSSVEAKGPKGR
jgi:hypothetical protein